MPFYFECHMTEIHFGMIYRAIGEFKPEYIVLIGESEKYQRCYETYDIVNNVTHFINKKFIARYELLKK